MNDDANGCKKGGTGFRTSLHFSNVRFFYKTTCDALTVSVLWQHWTGPVLQELAGSPVATAKRGSARVAKIVRRENILLV